MKFSDIPEDGIVSYMEGKKEKKDYWYNVYKFSEAQEKEWREWAREELKKIYTSEKELTELFSEVDMVYGFVIRYIKEGELF